MTDNDKKERRFDSSPTPPSSEEPQRHFEADLPKGPRKEARRGGFGSDFAPRRDPSPARPSQKRFEEEASTAHDSEQRPAAKVVAHVVERPRLPLDRKFEAFRLVAILLFLVPLTLFAYWPSWESILYAWWHQVDYSHGFFVIPLVALFLYLRFDTYPGTRYGLTWIGLLPIVFCIVFRYFAASQYMDGLDRWTIPFWVFGVVWFFYGTRVFFWALPSLAFLVFMLPLPWSYEVLMKNHLQQYAAQFAAVILQTLGEPAIPIKNTIRLSSNELSVEAACSGIRFLISVLAIAFAAILLMRKPWWQNIFVAAIAIPLALFVNAARIAMTGILLEHFPTQLEAWAGSKQSMSPLADSIAGITMIFVAVFLFVAFLWYLGKVFKKVEI